MEEVRTSDLGYMEEQEGDTEEEEVAGEEVAMKLWCSSVRRSGCVHGSRRCGTSGGGLRTACSRGTRRCVHCDDITVTTTVIWCFS